MASQTATWAIPYPQSADRFCDGPLFTQEMAERVDAILDNFDTEFARVEFPPMAEVSLTVDVATTSAAGGTVSWDTVEFDTASMVNLSLLPTSITVTPDTTGVYVGGANVFQTSSGSAGSYYTIAVLNEDDIRDNGPGQESHISVSALTEITAGTTSHIVTTVAHLGTAVTALTTKATSRMYAYWIGDV